jgi:hypothetical protein
MMGQQLVPRQRTELINLEEFVPQDHLLRAIDRYLDLTELSKVLSAAKALPLTRVSSKPMHGVSMRHEVLKRLTGAIPIDGPVRSENTLLHWTLPIRQPIHRNPSR